MRHEDKLQFTHNRPGNTLVFVRTTQAFTMFLGRQLRSVQRWSAALVLYIFDHDTKSVKLGRDCVIA